MQQHNKIFVGIDIEDLYINAPANYWHQFIQKDLAQMTTGTAENVDLRRPYRVVIHADGERPAIVGTNRSRH